MIPTPPLARLTDASDSVGDRSAQDNAPRPDLHVAEHDNVVANTISLGDSNELGWPHVCHDLHRIAVLGHRALRPRPSQANLESWKRR